MFFTKLDKLLEINYINKILKLDTLFNGKFSKNDLILYFKSKSIFQIPSNAKVI